MSDLKTCPFCGGEAELEITNREYPFTVWCGNVDCTFWLCGTYSPTKEDATRLWNIRQDGWVSVDDRLPKGVLDMVMAWDSRMRMPRFLLRAHFRECGVTYWQPLPEPPEGE